MEPNPPSPPPATRPAPPPRPNLTSPSGISVPATVEITAADDPSAGDGGSGNHSDPPTGEVHVRIQADSGCTHVSGSFVAPYCGWALCI